MLTTIAISIDNRVELVTNGNHIYWVQPVIGGSRFQKQVREVAGRKRNEAIAYFERVTERRLSGQPS